jgi:hypothetical protein
MEGTISPTNLQPPSSQQPITDQQSNATSEPVLLPTTTNTRINATVDVVDASAAVSSPNEGSVFEPPDVAPSTSFSRGDSTQPPIELQQQLLHPVIAGSRPMCEDKRMSIASIGNEASFMSSGGHHLCSTPQDCVDDDDDGPHTRQGCGDGDAVSGRPMTEGVTGVPSPYAAEDDLPIDDVPCRLRRRPSDCEYDLRHSPGSLRRDDLVDCCQLPEVGTATTVTHGGAISERRWPKQLRIHGNGSGSGMAPLEPISEVDDETNDDVKEQEFVGKFQLDSPAVWCVDNDEKPSRADPFVVKHVAPSVVADLRDGRCQSAAVASSSWTSNEERQNDGEGMRKSLHFDDDDDDYAVSCAKLSDSALNNVALDRRSADRDESFEERWTGGGLMSAVGGTATDGLDSTDFTSVTSLSGTRFSALTPDSSSSTTSISASFGGLPTSVTEWGWRRTEAEASFEHEYVNKLPFTTFSTPSKRHQHPNVRRTPAAATDPTAGRKTRKVTWQYDPVYDSNEVNRKRRTSRRSFGGVVGALFRITDDDCELQAAGGDERQMCERCDRSSTICMDPACEHESIFLNICIDLNAVECP